MKLNQKITINDTQYSLYYSFLCEKFSPVAISDHMRGKMAGMVAISTNAMDNPHCIRNHNNCKTVCAHCYALQSLQFMRNLRGFLSHNTQLLTSSILDIELLPVFKYADVVRFESHGDLINVTQCINYFNICNVNKNVTFTIWTKNPYIIAQAIKAGHKKPNNLIVVYSTVRLDGKPDKRILNVYNFIDKIFTVYSKNEILDNNIEINCQQHCNSCRKCYNLNDKTIFINEKLK